MLSLHTHRTAIDRNDYYMVYKRQKRRLRIYGGTAFVTLTYAGVGVPCREAFYERFYADRCTTAPPGVDQGSIDGFNFLIERRKQLYKDSEIRLIPSA
jgi:hypothetical protein